MGNQYRREENDERDNWCNKICDEEGKSGRGDRRSCVLYDDWGYIVFADNQINTGAVLVMTAFLSDRDRIWSSEKRYMALDCITGKPVRFGKHRKAIGSLEEALERGEENIVVELTYMIGKDKL